MMALELGIEVLVHGPADAEISDQGPGLGHIEYPAQHLRLKDRNPAEPQSLGACRKPEGLYRSNTRVLKGLGHGLTAEAAAGLRCLIGEHGKMHGSILEPFKLQSRILGALFAVIVFQRLRVGPDKTRPHRFATLRRFDQHEPPGLAVSDRG